MSIDNAQSLLHHYLLCGMYLLCDDAVTFMIHSQLHVGCASCCADLPWAQHACEFVKNHATKLPTIESAAVAGQYCLTRLVSLSLTTYFLHLSLMTAGSGGSAKKRASGKLR